MFNIVTSRVNAQKRLPLQCLQFFESTQQNLSLRQKTLIPDPNYCWAHLLFAPLDTPPPKVIGNTGLNVALIALLDRKPIKDDPKNNFILFPIKGDYIN